MKKRICALAAVLVLVLSMTVQASESRVVSPRLALSFDGTTAECSININGNSSSDKISVTVKLWHGDDCLKTWTDSGTGYLSFYETYDGVEVGEKYEMSATYKVGSKTYPTVSVSATCRG